MKRSLRVPSLALALSIFLIIPTPLQAQHMFLDLNGDSTNSSADLLTGTLPVNVDVYLVTDRNRNGSTVVCATGGQPLSIVSYEFILRAVGGTVLWQTLSGGVLGDSLRTAQNATDFYVGNFPTIPKLFPPGKIRLARIRVTPLSGIPLLSFVSSTALSATYLTSFGTECRGADGDNTMELGKEWQDADGTFGSLVANVGGTVYLDRNGSPVTCAPEAGESPLPGWMVSLNPGGGTALTSQLGRFEFKNVPVGTYTVQLAPVTGWSQTCPAGGLPQILTILPSQIQLGLNFGVRPNNSPPVLAPIPRQITQVGVLKEQILTAVDPDLSSVTFQLAGGPAFASLITTGPAAALLRLQPQPADSGSYMVAVRASDGVFSSERVAVIDVLTTTAVSSQVIGANGALAVSVRSNSVGSAATLNFRTSQPGFVRAYLYDIRGRRVRTLEDRPMVPAGSHVISLRGQISGEKPLASGVYFFRVDTSEGSDAGRAVIVK